MQPACQPSGQRGDCGLEQHWEGERRLFGCAAQPVTARGDAAGQHGRAPTARGKRVTPVPAQRNAQLSRRRLAGALAGDGTGRRAQHAQHEDRAAMRVDAARRGQHACFSGDAQALQCSEIRVGMACLGDLHEVAAKREQAAHEGVRIHVVVAAAVHQRHQPRLGRQRQFVVQRERGSASNRRGREQRLRPRTQRSGQRLQRVHAAAAARWVDSHHAASCRNATPLRPLVMTARVSPQRQLAHSRHATAVPSLNIDLAIQPGRSRGKGLEQPGYRIRMGRVVDADPKVEVRLLPQSDRDR